jgi:alpha-methylacyl-CoA racemase
VEYQVHQYAEDRQDEIRESFKAAFLTRTRDEWVANLASHDTCVAPVLTIPEVAEDPHWRARGVFMEAEHPERGVFEQVSPILAGGIRNHPRHKVHVGSETDSARLLEQSGFTETEIARLIEEGSVE